MATVTPILRTSKKDKKGRSPIWLRISDRDKTRFVSLGVKILPSQWNPRQNRVRKSHRNAGLINQLITKRLTEAEAEILRLKIEHTYATASDLKQVLQPEDSTDFFAFADQHVANLEKQGNIGRFRRLKAVLKKMRAFTGEPLPFDRLNVRLISDYETHMKVDLGNKQNTAASNLSDIRALVNKAVDRGLLEHSDNPFLRYSIKQGVAAERTKLSFDEVEAIKNLNLENGSLIWHVRNVFLFAFYAAGIRFSDVATMKAGRIIAGDEDTPDRLVYKMGKTGKRQSVKITPPARKILDFYLTPNKTEDDFVFPLLDGYDLSSKKKLYNARSSQNTVCNKYLKEIAKRAGIKKKVSMHVARHSFADAARKSGWSIYDISKALQHSKVSITERYLKAFDSKALDKKMDELFG